MRSLQIFDKLPRDVVNKIYRTLHSHILNEINKEYTMNFEFVEQDGVQSLKATKTYTVLMGFCMTLRDVSNVRIYSFKTGKSVANLPQRYIYSVIKTDMQNDTQSI